MIWDEVNTLPETLRFKVLKWRCPKCGSKCSKIGTPEVNIVSRLVNGGEIPAFECEGGCIIQPKEKEFSK